jgi:hypothetical protein
MLQYAANNLRWYKPNPKILYKKHVTCFTWTHPFPIVFKWCDMKSHHLSKSGYPEYIYTIKPTVNQARALAFWFHTWTNTFYSRKSAMFSVPYSLEVPSNYLFCKQLKSRSKLLNRSYKKFSSLYLFPLFEFLKLVISCNLDAKIPIGHFPFFWDGTSRVVFHDWCAADPKGARNNFVFSRETTLHLVLSFKSYRPPSFATFPSKSIGTKTKYLQIWGVHLQKCSEDWDFGIYINTL